jgi:hypothetical protein
VLAGLVLGVVAGYVTYKAKTDQRYQATAKIFVTSPAAPYLRTQQLQVTRQQPVVRSGTAAGTTGKSARTAPTIVSQAPDTQTLVNAANLYPQLILSDAVASASPAPAGCKLDASGIFASTNTFGVFKASPVPVLKVVSTCKVRGNAIPAAQERVTAFRHWIVLQQRQAAIPPKQRILVAELAVPVTVTTIGRPSTSLPVFVGLVVFLLFCGLAVLLDRRTSTAPATRQEQPSPSHSEA